METTAFKRLPFIFWITVGMVLMIAYVSIPNPSGKVENIVIRASFAIFDTTSSFLLSLFILKRIVPFYSRKKSISASILMFIAAVAIVITIRFSVSYYFMQRHFSEKILSDGFLLARIIISNLIYDNFMLMILLPLSYSGLRFMTEWYLSQTRIQKLENEKVKAELDFLKAQVNPHFLFNTLNAVYFTIDEGNKKGREILFDFSEMMRYQLYECNDDTVSISKELDYLEHYVDIERIRRDQRYNITFNNQVKTDFDIAPLLLLPFVENAFKHVSNFIGIENSILFEAYEADGFFCFTVKNTINPNKKDRNGNAGIGLKNVERRLNLLYPGKHSLTQKETSCEYEALLKINLS